MFYVLEKSKLVQISSQNPNMLFNFGKNEKNIVIWFWVLIFGLFAFLFFKKKIASNLFNTLVPVVLQ